MTKKELVAALDRGATLRELFDLEDGDACEIYKTNFWDGKGTDEIVYIADTTEWGVYPDDVVKNNVRAIQSILDRTWTGDEFLAECFRVPKVAKMIWRQCFWSSPSICLDDYMACSEPDDLSREAFISLDEAQEFFRTFERYNV